jgi:primosomal protein N' (replication factor Y)
MEMLLQYNIYIEVILPLALPKNYTYAVPAHLEDNIEIGKRVEIQFGKYKTYAAIIANITSIAPKDYLPKEIITILDEQAIVTPQQLLFWNWIATYYMCSIGEVMQAALPSYLKLDSESIYLRNPEIDYKLLQLSDDAYLICEAFEYQEKLRYKELQAILQKKTIYKIIKELIQNKLIYIEEILEEKYKPKIETFVRWKEKYVESKNRNEAFLLVQKAPKQEHILLAFIDLQRHNMHVNRKILLEKSNANYAALHALVEKEILELYEKSVDRIEIDDEIKNDFILNTQQKTALSEVEKHFQQEKTVLLHGVTSSGKTLVYTQLIKNIIDRNNQVLFLLPEIALTTQLINRLKIWLGNIAVYHSKLSHAERVEIWTKVLNNEIKIIVGARSALLLPFQKLDLIIVDEEHDSSYKQQEPNPRYHARDSALFLAKMHQANIILGSATPSFESYFNAKQKKYELVQLNNRYNDVPLPEIKFINLKKAQKNKELVSGITFELKYKIEDTLAQKKQAILFQNRRGYAPYLSCKTCNWIPMCKNCDITLTYHKYTNDLRCHYCGYTETHISQCKACGSNTLEQKGIGTERIEDDLKNIFVDAKIGRMDYDTVRNKHGHDKIIQAFQDGDYDILVGTQMITKGLDFKQVQLVGVLNADALLYFPDFRAMEKAYQLLIQVSGRAGRKDIIGNVFIQISNVEHPIVEHVLQQNFDIFYKSQIEERKAFLYPPFSKLIKIIIKHKDIAITDEASKHLVFQLKKLYPTWIKGPIKPVFQKINNLFIREILIKIPRENYIQLNVIKQQLQQEIQALYQYQKYKNIIVIKDVDMM